MLSTRIVTALILVPLVLAALFLLPPAGWSAAALAAIAVAALEWARLAGWKRRGQLAFAALVVLIGAAALLVPAARFGADGWPAVTLSLLCGPAVAFWLLVAPGWLRSNYRPVSAPIMAVTGAIVLIGAWAAVVELQARGPWVVLAAMAIVWIADTAAYFAGRAFGRHKLAPSISPGKTWEGVYGALLAVAAYALLLTPFAQRGGYTSPVTPAASGIWIALVLGLALLSIEGDLLESLLKRHAGVKDSGTILPGHGGVLDRIDALLSAMPAAALLTLWFLA
jgi:phosphatidate cytidylyltransferase